MVAVRRPEDITMVKVALFVRLEAKPGKEAEVERRGRASLRPPALGGIVLPQTTGGPR